MMAGNVRWFGPEFKAAVHRENVKRLHAAAITIENHARELISDGHPPASSAGDPPHVRTGALRNSVTREVGEAEEVARVGTNLRYGRYLELGTTRMAARPWLRRAMAETQAAVARIFTSSAGGAPRGPGAGRDEKGRFVKRT
jgi:HK97 gp10 family phage protein